AIVGVGPPLVPRELRFGSRGELGVPHPWLLSMMLPLGEGVVTTSLLKQSEFPDGVSATIDSAIVIAAVPAGGLNSRLKMPPPSAVPGVNPWAVGDGSVPGTT